MKVIRRAGHIEIRSIKLFRESRKGYVKVFDFCAITDKKGFKSVKGMKDSPYASRLQSKALKIIPSKFTPPPIVPTAPKAPYVDEDGTQILYYDPVRANDLGDGYY